MALILPAGMWTHGVKLCNTVGLECRTQTVALAEAGHKVYEKKCGRIELTRVGQDW